MCDKNFKKYTRNFVLEHPNICQGFVSRLHVDCGKAR